MYSMFQLEEAEHKLQRACFVINQTIRLLRTFWTTYSFLEYSARPHIILFDEKNIVGHFWMISSLLRYVSTN